MICSQCNKEFIKTDHRQKLCSQKCFKIHQKEYQKKYRQSDKGKEAREKYRQSDKGKEAIKIYQQEYQQTDNGKEAKERGRKKYYQSAKGKATQKRGNQKFFNTAHGKVVKKIWAKKYAQSAIGKETIKNYMQSVRGQEVKKKGDKKYYQSDKGKATRSEYHKERREIDPLYKLESNIRRRLTHFYKAKNIKKTDPTFVIVGCSPEFLKKHLEKQFHRHPDTHQPMNWKNHTLHGWHIDHKIPLSSAKTSEDKYKLCHYTNLQPMWAEYNLKKGNKII